MFESPTTGLAIQFKEECNMLFASQPRNAQALARLCRRFILEYPDFHKPYLTLAMIAQKTGLNDEALRLTHQAMQKAPFDRPAQIFYRSLKESLSQ